MEEISWIKKVRALSKQDKKIFQTNRILRFKIVIIFSTCLAIFFLSSNYWWGIIPDSAKQHWGESGHQWNKIYSSRLEIQSR